MLKAIIFDFDGVILESADIKTRAFVELFKDYPEHQERILRLHLDNAGVSRFEKFTIIYRDYLGKQIDAQESARLGAAFTALVYAQILRCPFVPGAREFLERRGVEYDLFIASGTPEDELRDIVAQRGLTHLFRATYGSPRSKGTIMRAILAQHKLQPTEAVFIGDALADFQGAHEAGVRFIGRVPPGTVNPFDKAGTSAIVADLAELDAGWEAKITSWVTV